MHTVRTNLVVTMTLFVALGWGGAAGAATWTSDAYVVVPGDFNGDGKDDVLVIAKDASQPSGIATSDGSGQPNVFYQSWSSGYLGITWSGGTYIPYVGDFNGDNKDDVFLQRTSGGNHYVLITDANGKLTSITQSISNSHLGVAWSAAERRIVVGDFNHVIGEDLFLQANAPGVDNVVALSASNGTFLSVSPPTPWPNDHVALEWSLTKAIEHAGDFNNDGYSDWFVHAKPNWVMIPFDDLTIPVPVYRPSSYGIVLPDGNGRATTLTQAWNHDYLGIEWSPLQYDAVVANFGGDACDDILLQAKYSTSPSKMIISQCGAQPFASATVHTLGAGVSWDQASYQLRAGDFNGDGRAEIYMQAPAGGTNRIAYTDGNGNVTTTPVTHSPSGNFKKPVPGAIPAEFRVSDQGAASYTIPIEAPAGTGGLKPNVALVYNHLAGDGLAGMHWALSGVSAITRCRTTYAQDGSVTAVNYTATDRFCLDGNRLVTSGTYGDNGTEYKTEMETFQRIVQIGTQAGGPLSFRVDHPNGISSYYGTTEDSRFGAASSVVRAWYLSYRIDQFGNRINYTYSENATTGEIVPSEIAWTQNAVTTSPKYKLTITYETRPAEDQRSGYDSGGAPWARTKRIDRIDVTYNSAQVRTYDLTYNAAGSPGVGTGRSQLAQLSECGPNDCLPPTVFASQNGTSGWGTLVAETNPVVGAGALVGDVNGDGRADLILPSGNWQVYLGDGAGHFGAAQNTGYSVGSASGDARIIDYDADGRADLLYKAATTWQVLRWTGSSYTSINTSIAISSPSSALIADFNGDGRQDWIYSAGSTLMWRENLGGSFATAQTISGSVPSIQPYWGVNEALPDINGDGRTDLIIRWVDCVYHPEFPEEPCGDVTKWNAYIASGSSYVNVWEIVGGPTVVGFRAADINGDGLDDLAYNAGGAWVTALSTGTGFATPVFTSIIGANAVVADYNNDGRTDLIRASGDNWYVHLSTGTTWSDSYSATVASPGVGATGGFAADTTGDGFPEIVRSWAGHWFTHVHATQLPDVVTSFTDGLGAPTTVSYAPLTNANVYTSNNAGTPPAFVRVFNGARYVVATETYDNGVGGVREFDHLYDTAYVNIAGRGWLSFYSHRVDEDRTGTPTPPPGRRTVRTFNRTFPHAGLLDSEVVTVTTGAQISTTNTVLSTLGQATLSSPGRFFPRIEESTTHFYGLGATSLREEIVDPTFDTTSGAISSITKKLKQTSPTQEFESTTVFNPTNLITSTEYCLGLPGLVTTTNKLPDTTTAARKMRYVFNAGDCTIQSTTDESDSNTAKQLRTTFSYDAYGNVSSASKNSVSPTQARSTTFTYDTDYQLPTKLTTGGVSLETNLTWNYLLGVTATIQGHDDLTTSYYYDDFGRATRQVSPTGTTNLTYDSCYVCWPQNARYYVRSQGSDGSDSYAFFDKLERTVGDSWTLPLGTFGRQETRYDAWGRVDRVSKPYVYVDPVFWVTYQYDNLDRVTQEDAPVSEAQPTGATTTYAYVGRNVEITDAESHLTIYENNALGQIAKVTDALSNQTVYTYRHFGELATVTDGESKVTTINYDARGFKSSMVDPNMGTWNYDYSIYGELVRQKSPNTSSTACGSPGVWTVCLAFDQAGRMSSRVESEGTTTFSYYTTGAGSKGKTSQVSTTNFVESYTYDAAHGAPSRVRRTIEGTNYDFDMTFDGQGRINVLTYPTSTSGYRFAVDYDYDAFGHLNVVKEASSGATFYTLTEADALGREVRVDLGDYTTGLDEYRTFDRASGYLKDIDTGPSLTSTIQNLSFTYDEVGNVETRTNDLIGRTETFVYDALNRLSTSQVNGQALVSTYYSAAGRITSKSDYGGTYTYGSASHPYGVTNAGGQSYAYDTAGRMTSHGSDTFTWYTYDLPKKLAAGTRTSEFFYGTDRQRYKQVQKTGSTTNATIYYVGTLFEKEVAGSTTTYRHYVSTQDRAVATVSRVGSTNTTQYLHRDHQGSVVEITSASGTLVQSLAYDAWGVRRSPATWAALGSPFAGSESLERGYTGHEHLDRVELIHMNGRVQDPRLGRFISADPTVPQPFDSQSYDRYSYVRNRPTTLVDPSGFTPCLDDFSCFDPGVDIGAGYGGRFSGWRPGAGLTISIPCEAVALCGPGVKDSSTPAGFDPLAVGTVAAIGSQAADVIRLPPFSWGALGQWGSRVAWPAAVIGSIIFPNKLGNGECIGNPVCEEQIRQMMEGQQDSPPTTDAGDNLETTPMSGDPNRQDDDRDDDVSEPGSKFPNRLVRRTTEEIRQGFEQRGFERSQSGRAELWTKGDRRYVIRPSGSRGTKIDAYKLDEFGEFRKLGEFIPK